MHTPPSLWIGQILKETYRIDKVIGEGGTGLVFAGVHLRLKVPIAIKVLKQNAGPVAFMRFRKEAEITAQLRHPNIVQVHDYDVTPDGHAYIVIEWLEGETLAAFLKHRGPLRPAEAVAILAPVCDAVSAAHAAGVVHRDLKPANLFLSRTTGNTEQPLIKVLDFGIAKLTEIDPVSTEQGQTVGTPRYMSPEQVRVDGASKVGPYSDQFALGSIAYELLAGRPAFPGSAHAAMLAVLEARPAPLPAMVPTGYRRAVERAMAREPEDRFPSVNDFLQALSAALEEPLPPPLPRKLLFAGAGLAGVLLGLVVWLARLSARDGEPVVFDLRPAAREPEAVPLDLRAAEPVLAPPAPRPRPPGRSGPGATVSVSVPVQLLPRGSQLFVNNRPVDFDADAGLEVSPGVAVKLRARPPHALKHCCREWARTYVLPAGKPAPPLVIELKCDRDCPHL